jgi:CBS domain containing-hemolysin-like protein
VIVLLTYVGVALGVSFLCSVLEAGLLSARPHALAARAAAGDRDAISAILTLNTIAHTVGATLAGAQAAVVFGDAWVGLFSGVLTFLVLVVTEIIPKTLGARYALALAGFVGRTLRILMAGMLPVVTATRVLTRWVGGGESPDVTRAEVVALLGMARTQGVLRGHESQVVENVLRLEDVRLEDVMTPRPVVAMMSSDASLDAFLASDEVRGFSRVPLYEGSVDHVVGYVLHRDVARAVATGTDSATPLARHRRTIATLRDQASVLDGLRHFLTARSHIVGVVDEFGSLRGVVTFEDLIETILGAEIVDEFDRVIDMRQLATERRDRRIARTRAEVREESDAP